MIFLPLEQPFEEQLLSKQWLPQKFEENYALDNFLKIVVGIRNRDVLYS